MDDAELREQIDKALDEFEKQIRADITNHITGDKSRNPAFSHIDARKDIEGIIKAHDAAKEREMQIEAKYEVYSEWLNVLEAKAKMAKAFNQPTYSLESDIKMLRRIISQLRERSK